MALFETDQLQAPSAHSGPLHQMSALGHEQVVFCNDPSVGLRAIIAVHNTVLGPSLGGTRMWPYLNEAQALQDVLRLSRGMSYKSAISGLNLGGGKAVIIGDPRQDKSEALMRRFGQFVESLGGKYITAEDVGITTQDIEYVAEETKHVAGLPESRGGGGDPSPVTAYGVFMGMKAALQFATGKDSLQGQKVMVQGVGHVGQYLVEMLVNDGAEVSISDIFADRIKLITDQHNVAVIDPEDVYDYPMDIYAPCALGATVNAVTIPKLKCSIIAGAANNQLEDEDRDSQLIADRGIVYAPDFLINAGGIINCYSEVVGYNRDDAYRKTERIYDIALEVLKKSRDEGSATQAIAREMAQARIDSIARITSKL